MNPQNARIGIIGLGQMGLGIALNLLKKGFNVSGYDLRPEARHAFTAAGGQTAPGTPDLVANADILLTSLVGGVYLQLAHDTLIPNARSGQIFIDTSTVPAPRTRAVAAAFATRNAFALDAPVTGGAPAAASGTLRMFVGGDHQTYLDCLPLLQAVCKPDGVTYGGPAGQGQVLKIVQQLKNRLTDAVRLEVIALGTRAGLTLDQVRRALDIQKGANDPYERLIAAIEAGHGDALDVVFAEWPYYLEEAHEKNIPTPALEALYTFCKDGEKVCRDGVNRMAPSVWRELSQKPRTPNS